MQTDSKTKFAPLKINAKFLLSMKPILINISLFLVAIVVFWLIVPKTPSADAHHSPSPLTINPTEATPKDTTSMEWRKRDSTLQARATASLKRAE